MSSTPLPGASEDALRFQTLLSRLSATFIHLPAEEVDGQIERALAQVVDYLGIERSSLAQFSADGRELIVTHSHTVAGFPRMPSVNLAQMMPWYAEQVRAGRVLRFRRLPDEIPPEATHEMQLYRQGGLPRSHLMIPFTVGEAVLGGVGFGSFRREIAWPDGLVVRLRLLGEVFANALARKVALEKESRLREQLALAARVTLMGELAASIAHEINQPLCALASSAGTLRRLLGADPPGVVAAREVARDVAADALRAGEIVSRIRGLFQMAPLRDEPLDLNALVGEVVTLARPELTRRGAAVRVTLGEGLPAVRGDRVGLQQVFLNLLANGAEAMAGLPAERRVLQIGTAGGGPAVRASVRDAGPGLDPATAERIFEAFFTTKPGGLGMGLAVCRSIVQRHAGRIWAEPADGAGTTFHVTLPAWEG